jgi:hypothetical protein
MQGFVQSLEGGVLIVAASTMVAVSTLLLLQRLWPPIQRMAHNDMVGPSVGVIGTTYAVIIAFMLSGVWSEFQAAQINAEQEANCLVNIFRFAERLPAEQGPKVQQLARDYSLAMIQDEWPAMERGAIGQRSQVIIEDLWRALAVPPHDATHEMLLDHSISELTQMTEHRRIRLLQSRKRLPGLLWAVLILGGVITVMSTCLFGVQNFRLHLVQVTAITLLLSLMLVAIAEVDRPYQGNVRVAPEGFRYALESIDRWSR